MFDRSNPRPVDGMRPLAVLREGLAGLGRVERSGWSTAARSAKLLELAEIIERAQAELVQRVAEWNAVGAWAEDGALSATSWLAARTPTTRPAAVRRVRAARLVNAHEQTRKALGVGDVTVAHVETLATVARGGRASTPSTKTRCSPPPARWCPTTS